MVRTRSKRTLRRAAERQKQKRDRRAQRTLALLTGSALSLIPGLAQRAAAQGPEDRWSLTYGYSLYSEGKLDSSKVAAGSADRYDIDTHQFQIHGPIGSRFSFDADVTYEKMTGASPWFIEQDINGDPKVVMTGASIEDARTDFLGSISYAGDTSLSTLSGGVSVEDDYTSINFGFNREKSFNQKNTTFSWGLAMNNDTSDPTSTSATPDPKKEHKQAGTFSVGFAQVIDRASAIQTSLVYQYSDGYLDDPYKLVSAGGVNRADLRPGTKSQFSWLTRYRHHFKAAKGSLHADYQFYWDTWDVSSHTFELGWYQTLFDRVTLSPTLRYYTQSGARFYAPFFASTLPADRNASSDYRLSPFGAISYRLRAETRLADKLKMDWRLGVQWEGYMSDGSFALGKVKVENPALVDFNVLMVTLQAGF
jgi:hypothetical protein